MRSSFESTGRARELQIVAEDLEVGYGKGKRVSGLRGFSAVFRPGITGLVGPNGAGKTTLLRAISGLLEPHGGHLVIGDADPGTFISRRGIGFLPEVPPLPGYLTGREFLAGLPGDTLNGRRANGSPTLSLCATDLLSSPIGSLSLGQRKKVALAAALSGDPEVLLLDEPTNGLDPLAIRELREALVEERALGTIILISSHHLDELQRIADALVFVNEGTVAGSWSREEAPHEFRHLETLFHHFFGGGRE